MNIELSSLDCKDVELKVKFYRLLNPLSNKQIKNENMAAILFRLVLD